MLVTSIYTYRNNFICSECIITIILQDKPWSTWRAVNNPDKYPLDQALNSIATMMGVDPRNPVSRINAGFPLHQPDTPEPTSFCVGCLRWFS